MVVEDDAKTRAWLAAVIGGSEGFACVAAHESAERAEREIVAGRPDVILLDLELPRMSGLEWLRSVNSRWPELPVAGLDACTRSGADFLRPRSRGCRVPGQAHPGRTPSKALADAHSGGAPMTGAIARLVLRSSGQAIHDPTADRDALGPGE